MAWSRPVEWWSRMAASIQDLARETYEDIMGWDPALDGGSEEEAPAGHKPPRPDIAKLKQYWDLKSETYGSQAGEIVPFGSPKQGPSEASKRWQELTEEDADEREATKVYNYLISMGSRDENGKRIGKDPFEWTIDVLSGKNPDWNRLIYHALGSTGSYSDFRELDAPYSPDEAKRTLSSAIRKDRIKKAPEQYDDIKSLLRGLVAQYPETYKLWPWAVKQIKNNGSEERVGGYTGYSPSHMLDIIRDAGPELNKMRQENRLPQGFDINKLDWQGFEDWWQSWKRDNREAESQGEVVYKFDDGYTIQRLTTPEQLQFEGDEMNHCVGGYDGPVGSGASIIYSLRDSKGNPHVTIEVEGRPNKLDENSDPSSPNAPAEYRAPHDEKPIEGEEQAERPTYDVVQVMGKGNYEPKPVYQNKIYEFLNSLRRQYGIVFQKSPGWHTPYDVDDDDPRWNADRDGYGNYDPDNDLVSSDIWWNYYENEPDQFHEDNVDGQYNLVIPKRRTGLFPKDKQQSPYGGGVYDSPEDMMRSAISQMMSPLGHTDWHEEALTVFHAMQVDGYSTDEMTKAWDDAATYLTSMLQSAQEDRSWGAGNDDAQRYMAYLLQLLQYTKEPDYKHEARMSVPGYDYQMLDPDETFTGPSSWEGDIAPNWPPAIPGTFSKIAEKEYASDPEYVYVYYMSELMVEPWEVNIRYERMLDQLLNKFGIDSMTLLDPSQVDAGEIRTSGDILHIEHKQLSDPEVRYYAERALEDWWAQERPKLKIFDWYEETPWKTLDPQQATDT